MVEKFRTGDCIGNHVGNIADTNHIEGNWNRKEVGKSVKQKQLAAIINGKTVIESREGK